MIAIKIAGTEFAHLFCTMPSILSLTLYPIKSCAGIALEAATLNETGLSFEGVHDREWMLVDHQGLFLTQREFPRMALIRPELRSDGLYIHAPNMPVLSLNPQEDTSTASVTIWEESFSALDCGQAMADWFSKALDTPCRLVRSTAQTQRFANQKWTGDRLVATRFSDGYPILLTATASLDDLNQRLEKQGRSGLPMNRFRPNIVLAGIEAFEEDYAANFEVGSKIKLRPVKPCPRCPMPSVDQSTGEFGPDPMDILQTYRANPLVDGGITFGMNVIVEQGVGQLLRVGDVMDMNIAF